MDPTDEAVAQGDFEPLSCCSMFSGTRHLFHQPTCSLGVHVVRDTYSLGSDIRNPSRMENSLGADSGAPEVIERDGTGTEHPAKLTKVLGISDEKTKSSRTNRRRVHDYIITMLYTTDPRPQPLLHSHRHILPKNYYAFKRYT